MARRAAPAESARVPAVPESPRPSKKTSRAKEVLEFWEGRVGKKLTSRDASEMQSNIEGVIALLAQWDRSDRAVKRPAKKHDAPKD
jgi:hypothetical protein